MKRRKGFVTNSSSSSFIIILEDSKRENVIKTKEELDKWFLKRAKDYYWLKTVKSIDDIFIIAEEDEDAEIATEEYNKLLGLIKDGKQFLFKEIQRCSWEDVYNILSDLGIETEWRD